MSKEKKIVELTDEELSKVNGGGVPTNANGEYVINEGDEYAQCGGGPNAASNFYALESIITSDPNAQVYVCKRQPMGISTYVSDIYVSISFLNSLNFKGNNIIDPHTIE